MKRLSLIGLCLAVLSGCGDGLQVPWRKATTQDTPVSQQQGVEVTQLSAEPPMRPKARPDLIAGTPPSDPTKSVIGTTVVSLGSPAEAGRWLKTPLVSSVQDGEIRYQGKTVDVVLLPIDGPATAGSRMSLEAFQVLDVPLTKLVEIEVVG